ncbi:MAG: hypothetical protein OIF54_15400 [Cohaesibacter sp.]|nr:hypothetical protein [Cohaesibacter sp.]
MTQDIGNRLFEQFERAVLEHGWAHISCARIAHDADIELAEAYRHYPSRFSYVSALIRRIDAAMLEDFNADLADEPARERLFDVLMGRFDAMQPHRPLIVALSKAARYDPKLALHLCALSALSAEWIMDMAHISSAGVMGQLRNKGALLAYGRAFSCWLEDDSEDMAKTMAVLDKVLKRGERTLRKTEKLFCGLKRLRRCSCRSKSSCGCSTKKDEMSAPREPVVDEGGELAPAS